MNKTIDYFDVQEYLLKQISGRPDELMAMEEYARVEKFPIIGPVAGNMCYQLARIIQAKTIFEMGSGYGYSTAWLAKAVQENGGGTVHHVVWDSELSKMARLHLDRLGYGEIVQFHIGEAIEVLRSMSGPFDLVFNDIDKDAYPDALPVIETRLRHGGMLIVDNMLLGGRVFDKQDCAASTEGVRELTKRINSSPKWLGSIVPIRDGLLLAYRAI